VVSLNHHITIAIVTALTTIIIIISSQGTRGLFVSTGLMKLLSVYLSYLPML
jgi:hypothetical protein